VRRGIQDGQAIVPPAAAGVAGQDSPARPRPGWASILFGYDEFLSFALGPPPRGTQSYVSDLARQLRERDLVVFFSETEALPGSALDSTLRDALKRSRALVVVANRDMLREPRWVRTEVEEFRKCHPHRPIIAINVGSVLNDPAVAAETRGWLDYQGRIWIDESVDAVTRGLASAHTVERLLVASAGLKSQVKWRRTVRSAFVLLFALAAGLGISARQALKGARAADEGRRRAERLLGASYKEHARQLVVEGHSAPAIPLLLSARELGVDDTSSRMLFAAAAAHLPRFTVSGHSGQVRSETFSPDGTKFATTSDDGTARVWDAKSGAELLPPLKHDDTIWTARFSRDGRRLVTASSDGTARTWDASTGKALLPSLKHNGAVRHAEFSPDGRRILTASDDGTARMWDATTGAALATLEHPGGVTSAAFSSDSKRILTVSGTVRVWDAGTGRPVGDPIGIGNISAAMFSHDGRRIATAEWERGARIWDARTGKALTPPLLHQGYVYSARFSPDDASVVTAGFDATA